MSLKLCNRWQDLWPVCWCVTESISLINGHTFNTSCCFLWQTGCFLKDKYTRLTTSAVLRCVRIMVGMMTRSLWACSHWSFSVLCLGIQTGGVCLLVHVSGSLSCSSMAAQWKHDPGWFRRHSLEPVCCNWIFRFEDVCPNADFFHTCALVLAVEVKLHVTNFSTNWATKQWQNQKC